MEEAGDTAAGPLSPELATALTEKPARPGMELLRLLRADGILTPLALMGALAIAVGAVLIETLHYSPTVILKGITSCWYSDRKRVCCS